MLDNEQANQLTERSILERFFYFIQLIQEGRLGQLFGRRTNTPETPEPMDTTLLRPEGGWKCALQLNDVSFIFNFLLLPAFFLCNVSVCIIRLVTCLVWPSAPLDN
jgi:hypothetical protein